MADGLKSSKPVFVLQLYETMEAEKFMYIVWYNKITQRIKILGLMWGLKGLSEGQVVGNIWTWV